MQVKIQAGLIGITTPVYRNKSVSQKAHVTVGLSTVVAPPYDAICWSIVIYEHSSIKIYRDKTTYMS